MEQDKDPESSPAHEVELDLDEEARRIILARRARFVAVALVSAGVTTVACGGQTSDGKGTPQPCLTYAATGGTGGQPQVCLGVSAGGAVPCLTIAAGGMHYESGGATSAGGGPQPCLDIAPGGAYGYGGTPQPCLTPLPTGGSPQVCLRVAPDAGAGGSADAAADAPPAPADVGVPVPCLSVPAVPGNGNES
jgi:hypothetical protein